MSKDLQLTPNDSTEIENYLLQAETEQSLIDVEFDKFVSEQAQSESCTAVPETQCSSWYGKGEGEGQQGAGTSYMEEYRFDLNGNVIYAPEMAGAYAPPPNWKDYGVVAGVEQMMQQCTLNTAVFSGARIPEVCRYFPNCKYGNSCRFFHPEAVNVPVMAAAVARRPQMCRYFPNCNFGDKCVFYHPKQQ